jgi:hypothetical protein
MAETVPIRVCKHEKIQALPEAFMSPMHDPRSVEMGSSLDYCRNLFEHRGAISHVLSLFRTSLLSFCLYI